MPESARLTHTAAVLLVRDLRAAAEHYRDRMGFTIGTLFGEPPTFTIVNRDDQYVMLKQIADPERIVPHKSVAPGLWDLYFWVEDVDALHEELAGRGANIEYGLCDQAYGCREFAVLDLDGHSVGFGQIID
ncbi:MAG TPA: VOC family protein [Rhodopila sp.]|jgi:catechol 2,3-dioxygenase-like lactoylglutathione lyase family enzyme|nr:VOC family protein [Rhodopila sp.]